MGDRSLPREKPVTFLLNGEELATIQATPEHLDELAVGFLYSEGFLGEGARVPAVRVDAAAGAVEIDAPWAEDALQHARRHITTGCGKGMTFASVGHVHGLRKRQTDLELEERELRAFFKELAVVSRETKQRVGGLHTSAMAFAGRGLTIVREDVGRHNTLDKILGRALLDETDTTDCILVTTGRLSYEMVVKAARARAAVVASIRTATDLAVEVAERFNICLVSDAKGGHYRALTFPGRIL